MIKKGDVVIIACLCVICVLLFIPSFASSEDNTAYIYLDGELFEQISMNSVSKDYTLSVGGCELQISSDGIEFISSSCPDKLCIKKGKLTRSGDTMACVPNKVVVSIKSESKNQIDAVAY